MFNDDEFPFRAMHAMNAMGNHMHRQMMQDVDMMMGGMMGSPFGFPSAAGFSPFGGIGMSPFGMLTDGSGRQPTVRRQQLEMDPFSGFGGLLGAMNGQMPSDGNMFVSTKVFTMGPSGQPRVEQQTMHKTGNVTETKRRVDHNGESHMTIGHSIGDRSHYIEKKRDKDGNVRKHQKFVNLDEASAEDFDREFATRVRTNYGYAGRARDHRAALGNGGEYSGRSSRNVASRSAGGAPIITLPDEEETSSTGTSTSSNRAGGPVIREISEEEAEQSIPKRRRGQYGVYRAE